MAASESDPTPLFIWLDRQRLLFTLPAARQMVAFKKHDSPIRPKERIP